jgi:transcriptional regulator with XRE-family HTH domain
MKSGALLQEARLRAGLTQQELAERTGRDRAVIARWEQEVVAPSLETLVDLLRACGFDLELVLVPYETEKNEQLTANLKLSPERRLERLVKAVEADIREGGRGRRRGR